MNTLNIVTVPYRDSRVHESQPPGNLVVVVVVIVIVVVAVFLKKKKWPEIEKVFSVSII